MQLSQRLLLVVLMTPIGHIFRWMFISKFKSAKSPTGLSRLGIFFAWFSSHPELPPQPGYPLDNNWQNAEKFSKLSSLRSRRQRRVSKFLVKQEARLFTMFRMTSKWVIQHPASYLKLLFPAGLIGFQVLTLVRILVSQASLCQVSLK
jgi:hypothetical protein